MSLLHGTDSDAAIATARTRVLQKPSDWRVAICALAFQWRRRGAIHGLTAQTVDGRPIHGLRKTIHGWSRSPVCAEHIHIYKHSPRRGTHITINVGLAQARPNNCFVMPVFSLKIR